MKRIKVWPHLTVVALLFAALGGVVAALWTRQERKAEAATLPSAARIERVDGEVGLARNFAADASDDAQWMEVTPNTPLTVGDRVYARDNSRTGIAFTGRNFARLEPNSSLDVLSLSDDRTQLALREGSAVFNVGELEPDDMFEVATPFGAFDLEEPGLYEVGLNDDGSAWVSVLSGLVQVAGLAGTGQVSKGEMLTLLGQTAADLVLSRVSPDYAGGLVDDYYGYQYPDIYDGRYRDYNAYLNDPYYYDPYNRYTSYRHVDDRVPGIADLDRYGDWQNLNNYGYSWRPRVESGWTPYQQGYWTMDDPHGLTWVSNEPWGYAPYHYGRWVNADGQWYWVPERESQPAYSPALVAFVPLTQENIGWVPLAPGDQYVPTYYDANWQPHYLTQAPSYNGQVANLYVPGAVTVVPVNYFDRVISPDMLVNVQPEMFNQARPVLDPLSVAALRQAALQTANAHRRVDLPPGIAKRLNGTQVFTSARPFAPPFREDLVQAFRAEQIPEKQRGQKIKFKDERQSAQLPMLVDGAGKGHERKQQIESLKAGAARGDKEAKRQMQALRQQERIQERIARQQSVPRPHGGPQHAVSERGVPQAQGERVGQSRKAEKEAARQQMTDMQQQQRAVIQQQNEARKRAERQQQPHAVQQQPQRNVQQGGPKHAGRGPQAQAHQPQGQGQQKQGGGPPQAQGQGGGKGKGKGRP